MYKKEFYQQMAEVFIILFPDPVFFFPDRVRSNIWNCGLISEDSLQNWVTWADKHIAKFIEALPCWLCDISLAKSLKDVRNALGEGNRESDRLIYRGFKNSLDWRIISSRLHIG